MNDYSILEQTAGKYGAVVLKNEPMKNHTSFRIGGPCDVMIKINCEALLCELIKLCRENDIKYYVVGRGSNILVCDEGLQGVVLLIGSDFGSVRVDGEYIECNAGASLAAVCAVALENELTGLEFAYGIPGSVGGAIFMNAGAYGGEMKDVVRRVHSVSAGGIKGVAEGEALKFSYRKSRYTGTGDIITSVEYVLKPGSSTEISGKMEELMQRRKEKQPYDMPSAGSVFKRPEGAYAAALIEGCGLKGLTVGEAQVSPKHAGFIVNLGNASCGDVLQLIDRIRETVYREKGIQLECEVRMTE